MTKRVRRPRDLVRDRADIPQRFGKLATGIHPDPCGAQQVEPVARHAAEQPLGRCKGMLSLSVESKGKTGHATICPFFDRLSGGVVADWMARSRMRVGFVGDRNALRAGSPTRTCGTGRRSDA